MKFVFHKIAKTCDFGDLAIGEGFRIHDGLSCRSKYYIKIKETDNCYNALEIGDNTYGLFWFSSDDEVFCDVELTCAVN